MPHTPRHEHEHGALVDPGDATQVAAACLRMMDDPQGAIRAQARALAASRVPVVAWVACDPVTFARDARIMAEGGYRLERLEVIDQFRWSPHVELAAAFRKHSGVDR